MTLVDPMRPVQTEQPRRFPAPLPIEPQPSGGVGTRGKKRTRHYRQAPRTRIPKRFIAAIVLVAALIVSPEIIGQILVISYGLLTILRRFSMVQTFVTAAVLVLLSPVMTWLTGSEENGSVLAGYSFMLLGVGLLQLILAYRHVNKG
jgi:hypothetical protein